MKTFIPTRMVDPPELSEEEISKLMEGRYVEGEFGLEEGDVFIMGDREVLCYRMIEDGKSRVRRMGV